MRTLLDGYWMLMSFKIKLLVVCEA